MLRDGKVSLLPIPCRPHGSEDMGIEISSSSESVANFADDTALILPHFRPVSEPRFLPEHFSPARNWPPISQSE
jgi:hypothetical protein